MIFTNLYSSNSSRENKKNRILKVYNMMVSLILDYSSAASADLPPPKSSTSLAKLSSLK
tara:strand:- start:2383 stop:2559 length:177 start_codon:yes stop_codon:yes gene_type:complete